MDVSKSYTLARNIDATATSATVTTGTDVWGASGFVPIGGVAGTIRSAYKTDNGLPFVWAKTGSLMNVHNQSGYIVTRKGKRLTFSFMNNNFTRPSREIRDEMVRIMTYIHDNY